MRDYRVPTKGLKASMGTAGMMIRCSTTVLNESVPSLILFSQLEEMLREPATSPSIAPGQQLKCLQVTGATQPAYEMHHGTRVVGFRSTAGFPPKQHQTTDASTL